MNWADQLVYGGYDDWRLPDAYNQDGSGPDHGGRSMTGKERREGEGRISRVVRPGPRGRRVAFRKAFLRTFAVQGSWNYRTMLGSGFAYAMLYPGMQKVIQAAGRVIRTMDDQGIIALLDKRFAEEPYIDAIPPEWYRSDPRELVSEDPERDLAEFWESLG